MVYNQLNSDEPLQLGVKMEASTNVQNKEYSISISEGTEQMSPTHRRDNIPESQSGYYSFLRDGILYTVIVDQPARNNIIIQRNYSSFTNWVLPAIISCICCFWPIGICAVIAAVKANTATEEGDVVRAEQITRTAKVLTIATFTVGLVFSVYFILYNIIVNVVIETSQLHVY